MLKTKFKKVVSILICISIIVCMFMVQANALTYKDWQTSDNKVAFSDSNSFVSAMDCDGNVYMVTKNTNSLDFAINKGGTVSAPVTIVTDPNARLTDLFVDVNKKVHLFYEELNQYSATIGLYYVTNKSGSWSKPVLAINEFEFDLYQETIDNKGAFHLCYYDGDKNLYYVSNESGKISAPKIICATNYSTLFKNDGQVDSIAVDNNGSSYVTYDYQDKPNKSKPLEASIKYITNKSGKWSAPVNVATIETNPPNLLNIAIDKNKNADIVYYNANAYNSVDMPTKSELFVVSNASGSWKKTSIDKNIVSGYSSALIFDSQNNIHIVYECEDSTTQNEELKYATNVSGNWVTSIFKTSNSYECLDFSCGSNDRIQLLYDDIGTNTINYAYKDLTSVKSSEPSSISSYPNTGSSSNTPIVLFGMSLLVMLSTVIIKVKKPKSN